MARFYGWTDDYINHLSLDKFQEYFMAIDVISAQEAINGYDISIYPHLKNEDRTKRFNDKSKFIKSTIYFGAPIIKGYGEVIANLRKALGRG